MRIREQGFYLLLIAPAIGLMVVFFALPLAAMVQRSFQDGRDGLLAADETPRVQPGAPGTFKLAHAPIVKLDDAELVRPVAVSGVEPSQGLVTLSQRPTSDETVLLSYNGVRDEVAVAAPVGLNTYKIAHPPVLGRRDEPGTPADVTAKFEQPITVTSADVRAGTITLGGAVGPGQQLVVTYHYHQSPTLAQYAAILRDRSYTDLRLWRPSLFRTTFEIPLFTALGCAVIGYPLAYLLANISAKWRGLLIPLVVVPFWTSTLVRSFAWYVIFGKFGPVNWTLLHLGITRQPVTMVFSRLGVYIGMIQVLLPYVVLPSLAVMLGMPRHLLRAGESLGASPLRLFLRVFLPLSLPGVAVGALLVFILCLGSFVPVQLLGSSSDRMLVNMIVQQIEVNGSWEFGAALSFLLLVTTFVMYLIYGRGMKLGHLQTPERAVDWYAAAGDPAAVLRRPLAVRLVALARRIGRMLQAAAQRLVERVPFTMRVAAGALAVLAIALGLAVWVYQVPPLVIEVCLAGVPLCLLIARVGSAAMRVPLPRLILCIFSALIFLYLVAPNIILIPVSLTNHPVYLDFPGHGFTLRYFDAYFGLSAGGRFGRGGWIAATATSLEVAALVVLVSVPLGSLAAYGLVRGSFPAKNLLMYFVLSPLVVPSLVTGISLFIFFSRYMRFLLGGLTVAELVQIPLGFVIGHSLLAVPYVVFILAGSLGNIDPMLEQAAMSMGATRLTAFRRVVVPLMIPAIAAASFFSFLTSFDELPIALFLSTPQVATLPKRMWDGVTSEIDPTITAISTLLVLFTMVVIGCAALSQSYLARSRGRSTA